MPLARRLPPLLLLPLLLVGCRSTAIREEAPPPFVFRSLDLRQQDLLGRPTWTLTSPEARYDLRLSIARVRNPRGTIHAAGTPLYRVMAETGTVINDGEVILLEGRLRVERLGSQPMLILADRARWLPARKLMVVDRHPQAYDRHGRLRAALARFQFDQDQLQLSGSPRLERWSQPFDPLRSLPRQPAQVVAETSTLTWSPGSGRLLAGGPLTARGNDGAAPGGQVPMELRAEGLEGNTLSQTFLLRGAVQFSNPARAERFEGRDVRLDLAADTASTAAAFEGSRGALRVRGDNLRVDGRATTAEISRGCRIEQPGEQLTASRCLWSWSSGRIDADGAVEVQRAAQEQTTRAERLRGSLGSSGFLEANAPSGGRVVSRFRVPPPSARPSR